MSLTLGTATKLDEALDGIALYYGILRKDAFNTLLMSDTESTDLGFSPPDPSIEDSAVSLLTNIVEGGLFINEYLGKIAETSAGEDGTTFSDKINQYVCITSDYNDLAGGTMPQDIPGYNASNNGNFRGQGDATNIPVDGNAGNILFDIDHSMTDSESDVASAGHAFLNINTANPTKSEPSLGVIQIFPPKFDPSNNNTDAMAFFLAGIPTLELSRAVPYIDVRLITEGSSSSLFPESDSRYINTGTPNLTGFLYGRHDVGVGDDTAAEGIVSGRDTDFDITNEANNNISTSGMELFTAPQTLVNANESHREISNNTDSSVRSTPVIDKFRPLMTLNNLKFTVTPSVGLFSHKTGAMTITLHDRSRLHEVAHLVKPSLYGKLKLMITYGWSHPDGKLDSTSTLSSKYGQFIDALKVKEFYQVVNTSYSFTADGQVEIQAKLSMLGQNALNTTKVYLGEGLVEEAEAIQAITEAISVIRSRLSNAAGGVSELEGFGFLESVSSDRTAATLDDETMQEVRAFINSNSNSEELQELGNLRDLLKDLYGTAGDGSNGALRSLETSIASSIGGKITDLKRSDPFFRPVNLPAEAGKTISWHFRGNRRRTKKYVSFGMVLSSFLGVPLAKTGQFDEVQLLFYSFNDKASFMKDFNIAQYPVSISDFDTFISEELKKNPKMTVNSFVGFMNKYFFSDQGQAAYGMSGIYAGRDEEDATQRVLATQYMSGEEVNTTKLLSAKQRILRAAYGDDDDLTFRKPVIQMRMESVPHQSIPNKVILRVYVTDQVQTSHSGPIQLLSAARNSQIGMINIESRNITSGDSESLSADHASDYHAMIRDAIDRGLLEPFPVQTGIASPISLDEMKGKSFRLKGGISAIKGYLRSVMPYFRYGTGTSGVHSANLQSMQNSALASVNMLRNGSSDDEPSGYQNTGVPLRVAPMELTLECMGFPLATVGQQIFCDFDTGTTADNIYSITGIEHSIKQGEFGTSLKLVNMPDAYGKYETLFDMVGKAIKQIGELDPESNS